jgi:hypothetical protein
MHQDGPVPETPRRTGRPPVTSRPQILAAARPLIDADSWEKRLAAEVGTGPTTLYDHVRDKQDLLGDPRDRIVPARQRVVEDARPARPWATEILTTDGLLGDRRPALAPTGTCPDGLRALVDGLPA